jgi:hypothetical protein
MDTLLAFLIENMLVSTLDILMAGLGAYWIARQRKMAGWGVVLLAVYTMAAIGLAMGPDGLGIGPIFGLIAAVSGVALAIYQNQSPA